MLQPRVVPVLLIKRGGLVKTTKFANPVYLGDPLNAIRIFNEKEVDELVLLDIETRGEAPDFDLVESVASECFMPLAYGGGVSTLEDAKRLFSIGVEKVVLRRAAAQDLRLVSRIAAQCGSQSVAVCIDIRKARWGGPRVHAPGTVRDRGKDWLEYVTAAERHGAGEVVLQSVDRDGTMDGMDLGLISEAAQRLSTPLLAVGGVGSLAHMHDGLKAGATAIGAGAFFVFQGPRRAVLISYPDQLELGGLGTVRCD